jgi:uncharacterized protein YjbJ (UPF0337 family)
MKSKRKEYEKKLDAELRDLNAQIELLKAKADKVQAEVKGEYGKAIEALQQHKLHHAKGKLQELKSAGDDAWEDIKKGAEKAWDDMKTAYQDASARFK